MIQCRIGEIKIPKYDQTLGNHHLKYLKNMAKFKLEFKNYNLIQEYIYRLQTEKIECQKYSSTIDWHNCYESVISLSKDAKELIIMNKKMVK